MLTRLEKDSNSRAKDVLHCFLSLHTQQANVPNEAYLRRAQYVKNLYLLTFPVSDILQKLMAQTIAPFLDLA
jgi:hypothetical protein